MFKKNNTADINGAITSATSIIASGMVLTGDLVSQHALRIDGEINGDIHCSEKLIIGPDGRVNGNINSKQVIVMGRINGNIHSTESLVLKGKAILEGNIKTRMLTIEPEVVFNGCCNMDADSWEMPAERSKTRLKGKTLAMETIN